ncbi:MAG: NfeD family protein [Thermoplasmatota archaeon]
MGPEISALQIVAGAEIGIWLIVAGIVLIIVEAIEPGFFIAIPAGVLIVIGIIQISNPGFLFSIYTPVIVAAVVLVLTFGSLKFYQKISPPSKPTTTMSSSLEGRVGKVVKTIKPDEITGKVKIENQLWSATSKEEKIEEGKKVQIIEGKGVHLLVEEKKD